MIILKVYLWFTSIVASLISDILIKVKNSKTNWYCCIKIRNPNNDIKSLHLIEMEFLDRVLVKAHTHALDARKSCWTHQVKTLCVHRTRLHNISCILTSVIYLKIIKTILKIIEKLFFDNNGQPEVYKVIYTWCSSYDFFTQQNLVIYIVYDKKIVTNNFNLISLIRRIINLTRC